MVVLSFLDCSRFFFLKFYHADPLIYPVGYGNTSVRIPLGPYVAEDLAWRSADVGIKRQSSRIILRVSFRLLVRYSSPEERGYRRSSLELCFSIFCDISMIRNSGLAYHEINPFILFFQWLCLFISCDSPGCSSLHSEIHFRKT